MAGFATGLVNTLTSGLNDRLNIKRQRDQQLQQEQDALRQNQLLFEQGRQQQLQAQPQQMQMAETQIKNNARIQQELMAQAQQIPIKTTPGLREVLASGDMQQINSELPKLVQTKGDVEFYKMWRDMAAKLIDPAKQAGEKETAIQNARIAGDLERKKQGVFYKSQPKTGGGSKSSSASNKQSSKLKSLYLIEKDSLADLNTELKDMLQQYDEDSPEILDMRREISSAKKRVNQFRNDYQSSLGTGGQSSDDADALIEGLKKLSDSPAANEGMTVRLITKEEFEPTKPADEKTKQKAKGIVAKVFNPSEKATIKKNMADREYSKILLFADKERIKKYNQLKKAGMK